jgi:outer membrane protein insertion porin family
MRHERAILVLLALVALGVAACRGGPPSRLASVDEEEALATYGFAVVFDGNRAFDDRELETVIDGQLDDFAAQGLRPAFIDDAAYVLEQHYRAAGYHFATVTYDLRVAVRGTWVHFEVDEGPRVALDELRIEGLTAIPVSQARGWFEFPTDRDDRAMFSDRAVRAGVGTLVDQLLARGYLVAAVDIVPPVFRGDRSAASVTLVVREGPRYTLKGVSIDGLSEEESRAVGPLLERSLDEAFTPRLAFELRNRVLEWYGQRGHADVQVDVERDIDDQTGNVLLTFRIVPGPRVRIAAVRITGNRKTRGSFVKERLQLEAGDTYSRDRMRESFRRLYQAGLFERVGLSLQPPLDAERVNLRPDEEARDLAVELVELPSQEFFVEPGYGSYEQLRLRLGYRERNLFGTGRAFRAEVTAALLAQRALLGLTDTSFFFDDLRADFSVRGNERQEPSFTRQEIGFTASFTWPLAPRLENTVAYEYRHSRVTDIDIVDQALLDELAAVDISSVRVSPRFDTRDDLFVPSRGWLARATAEIGDALIGSELDFLRLTGALSNYISLDRDGDTVLGFAVEAGTIVPRGDTSTIPLQERFFLGGENNVRAFRESQLGPKDVEDNPIGGEAYSFASAELRQRIVGKLQGAVFFDTGSVILDYTDWTEFEEFRYGVGAGLRYVLPVGPLRLDVGWNPEARAGEDDFVIHFALGMSF